MRGHLRRKTITRGSLYGDLYLERELARLRREAERLDPIAALYWHLEANPLPRGAVKCPECPGHTGVHRMGCPSMDTHVMFYMREPGFPAS